MKRKSSCSRIFLSVGLGIVLLLGLVAAYLFWPVNARALASHPAPYGSYAEAAARVEALNAQETGLNPACPRYSTRALSQTLRLALAVKADAEHSPLQVKNLVVITNDNDPNVYNELVGQVAAAWEKNNPGKVDTYQFPADLLLGHYIIDPNDKDGNIEVVYPVILKAIRGE